MTPQEQRGQRLFLILATVVILPKLFGIIIALSGGLANVRWSPQIFQPICLAMSVAFLWQGETWLKWLVGATCILSGAVQMAFSLQMLVQLAWRTPPRATGFYLQIVGIPFGMLLLFGLLYVITGLLFCFSPSLRAFFTHQRMKRQALADIVQHFASLPPNESDSDDEVPSPVE